MTISTLPTPSPNRSQTQEVFAPAMDATLGALPTLVNEINSTVVDINNNTNTAITQATIATNQANSAASSAATASSFANAASLAANATLWVSGATVDQYAVVISPANFQNYRRKTATGSGTTDPSLDATNYERITAVSLGVGSTTVSGTVILTNASTGSQVISSNNLGDYFQLPDGRTLIAGEGVFTFKNNGYYDQFIKDAAGNFLAVIRAQESVTVNLTDNTTLAGTWSFVGASYIGVDVYGEVSLNFSPTATNSTWLQVITLDTDRSLFLIGGNNAVVGVVYNSSAKTFGTSATIGSTSSAGGNSSFIGVLAATDKVLVAYGNGTTAALNTVVLTVSGYNISLGTTVVTSLSSGIGGGSNQALSDFVQVGSSFILIVGSNQLVAITVTGTSNTVGTVQSFSNTSVNFASRILYFTSSVFAVLSYTEGVGGSTNPILYASVFSVSGTTLTTGTNASINPNTSLTAVGSGYVHVRKLSSGRYCIVTSNGVNAVVGTLLSLSGTVASFTAFTNICSLLLTSASNLAVIATGNQVVVAAGLNNAASYFSVVTDNAGSLVTGSVVAKNLTNTPLVGIEPLGIINNEIYFDVVCYNSNTSSGYLVTLSLSGNNISSSKTFPYSISVSGSSSSLRFGWSIAKSNALGAQMFGGSTNYSVYTLQSTNRLAGIFSADNNIKVAVKGRCNYAMSPNILNTTNNTYFGPSSAEAWILNCQAGATQAVIQKVRLVG